MMSRIIVWLRNDLRVKDNYALHWAATKAVEGTKEVIPVFCFDPRQYSPEESVTRYESRKTGSVRTKFQIESVADLRQRLNDIGSHLLISNERPEDFIPKLISETANNYVVYQQEICHEELKVEKNLVANLSQITGTSIDVQTVWGSTINHIDDLPYNPREKCPWSFTQLNKEHAKVDVRPLVPPPPLGSIPFPSQTDQLISEAASYLPCLEEFGFTDGAEYDDRASFPFRGGESAGLERLQQYIFDNKSLSHYAQTRNELSGSEFSSKISPWLANGTISIRDVYHQVRLFEKTHGSSKSTTHFVNELFWREFCRIWCIHHGRKVFFEYGPYNRNKKTWRRDLEIIRRWKEGMTGMPLIDAFMRDTNKTGFMSNRGRQIVASYLTNDLNQDWRWGAHHFEEILIDHDVQSNYKSWVSCAGLGPNKVLLFNALKQSRDFDQNGEYIRAWVPELTNVATEYIHEPWKMPKKVQQSSQCSIGTDYPYPIPCKKYVNGKK